MDPKRDLRGPQPGTHRTPSGRAALLLGRGDPIEHRLREALEARGMRVASFGRSFVSTAIVAESPDVVVLIGDAAEDGGSAVLKRIDEAVTAKVARPVPLVLVSEDAALDARGGALRSGVRAIVPRTESVDEIATRIARIGRDPSTAGILDATGAAAQAVITQVVAGLRAEQRTGVLSVHALDGSDVAPVRLVMRAGRAEGPALGEFLQRMSRLAARTERLSYAFEESEAEQPAAATTPRAREDRSEQPLDEMRVLVVATTAALADAVAERLRQFGAVVVGCDAGGKGLNAALQLDPHVLLIDERVLQSGHSEVVDKAREDLRLRWATVLLATEEELSSSSGNGEGIAPLVTRLAPLLRPEQALKQRLATRNKFEVKLDTMGPARMLRAITSTGSTWRTVFQGPRAEANVELTGDLVASAFCSPKDASARIEGPAALGFVLGMASGWARIERTDQSQISVNLMSPVDEALGVAANEAPKIAASLLPPRGEIERMELALAEGRGEIPPAREPDPDRNTEVTVERDMTAILAMAISEAEAAQVDRATLKGPLSKQQMLDSTEDTREVPVPDSLRARAAPPPPPPPPAPVSEDAETMDLPSERIALAAAEAERRAHVQATARGAAREITPSPEEALEIAAAAATAAATAKETAARDEVAAASGGFEVDLDAEPRAEVAPDEGAAAAPSFQLPAAEPVYVRAERSAGGGRNRSLVIGAIALILFVVTIIWWMSRGSNAERPPAQGDSAPTGEGARGGSPAPSPSPSPGPSPSPSPSGAEEAGEPAAPAHAVINETLPSDPNAPCTNARGRAPRTRRALRSVIARGEHLLEENQNEQAQRAFCTALRMDDHDEDALAGLTRALLAEGHPGLAARWARKVIDVSPHRVVYRQLLATALEQSGDDRGARAARNMADAILRRRDNKRSSGREQGSSRQQQQQPQQQQPAQQQQQQGGGRPSLVRDPGLE